MAARRRADAARARQLALALPVAAAAALAPLALGQRSNDSAAFIGESGLDRRLAQVVKQFLVGYDAPAEKLLAVVSAVVLLTALAGLVALLRGRAAARTDARRLLVVATAAVVLPALLALAGEDHVVTRNVVAALPLAAALAGAGLAAVPPPAAIAATATACALALVAVIGVASAPALQRDDWRGAARALGPAPAAQTRIVVAAPGALIPLRYYLPRLRPFGARPVTAAQIDYLALAPRRGSGRGTPPRPPSARLLVPAFRLAGRTEDEAFTVLRLTAREPRPVLAGLLSEGLDGERSELLRQLPA